MSRLARAAALVAFALAYLSQPLTLDACAVSCEAARAARTPAVAAPCHHTTSCATQISQPTPTGSTTSLVTLAPPAVAVAIAPSDAPAIALALSFVELTSSGPPVITQLRL